jgi:hypothetical protein
MFALVADSDIVMTVRAAKTTKEIETNELEMLKRPEARETTAFDPTELQGLIEASREEDDLALPVEAPASIPLAASSSPSLAASSNVTPMPVAPAVAAAEPPRVARGSARTPKASKPLPKAPRQSSSLMPWIVVAIAAAIVVALAFWQ